MTDLPNLASAPIHIVLAFDDNFWAPAYAVMRSVCLTSRSPDRLHFHLCHDAISPEHLAVLNEVEAEFGAKTSHYALEADPEFLDFVQRLPLERRFRRVIYARLLLDRLLPGDITRVIYLDSDTMAMGDIAQIWESDLAGNTLGAVSDPMRLFNMYGRDLREKRDLFEQAAPYFNSGMLVIDLQRFAAAQIARRLAEFESSGVLKRLYYDQDILNLIFRGDWQQLDWRFNIVDPHMAHQAMDPVILHYTLQARPWTLRAGLFRTIAFARLYRHIMTNSVFYAFLRQRWTNFWLSKIGWSRR